MEVEKKLNELGYELPNPPVPAANYIGFVRVGNLLFIGGNIGRINGQLKYRGKVGGAVTLDQAYEAARNCALNHIAIMKAALGDLDRVERIVKVLGYVNVAPGFTDMPKVVNGESDLLVRLWGDRGQHTRAAVGVASLSQDAPVETEVTVLVKDIPSASRDRRTSSHGKFYRMVEASNRGKSGCVADRKIKSRRSTTGARSWRPSAGGSR